MSETVDSLKQRLVGAFVILSLAVIFLPMIFDKPHSEGEAVHVPVPPKPQFKTIEISQPKQPTFKVMEVDKESGKIVKGEAKVGRSEPRATSLVRNKPAPEKESASEAKKAKPVAAKESNVAKATDQKNSSKSKATTKPLSTKKPSARESSKPVVSQLPVFKNVWMVQLGTFSKQDNAYRLRDKLRSDGFDAHTKVIKLGGKQAVRVFTGPFVKKREALKIKKRLDQKYKVDSRLIFFDA